MKFFFKRDKDKEEDVQPILRKGIDFDLRGKHEKALSCYDKALKIDPNSIYVLINKGTALDYLGRRIEALHYYDRALEIDPNNEYALADKSLALANIGKHKDNKIFEQYFVEKELKGNWRNIIPTDQQSSITNQQPKSRNWHIYNALDNTSCEIHMLKHDDSRCVTKFNKDANVLVTTTRLRYNGEDLRGGHIALTGYENIEY